MPKIINTEDYIAKAKIVHHNFYDYGLWDNVRFNDLVSIICPDHGIFTQRLGDHLKGIKCKSCGYDKRSHGTNITREEFLERAKSSHGELYDYSKVVFSKLFEKVEIVCLNHGSFWQNAIDHTYSKAGCPKCTRIQSKGSTQIESFLVQENIKYIREYTFNDCRSVRGPKLPFDFFLPDYEILIEFDGQQHFEPYLRYGGEKQFKITQENDIVKNEYSERCKIPLLRISYKQLSLVHELIIKFLHAKRKKIN